jgi:hypothetical protein
MKALLAGVSFLVVSEPVLAQSSGDVVVMRRVLTDKKKGSGSNGGSGDTSGYEPAEGTDTSKPFWAMTPWVFGDPTCSDSVLIRRGVGCVFNGSMQADSACADPKPADTATSPDYRSCSYEWKIVGTGEWSSQCSQATRSLQAVCVIKDKNIPADDASCRTEKPTVENAFNEAGCSYQWSVSDWSPWQSGCSAATSRSRSVACKRSDGTTVQDGACSGEKPAGIENGSNYESCGLYWETGNWTPETPGCGKNQNLTRTITCKKQDGTTLDPEVCSGITPPATTMIGEDYSGCTYAWSADVWSDWSSLCSDKAKRTRDVVCRRSDGQSAESENCTETKPAIEENGEIYSGCTYSWKVSDWSSVNACSTNVERTRSVECVRSDNSSATEDKCFDPKPATSENVADFSSCTYAWEYGNFTWDSSCSDLATGVRTVICRRSNGDSVGDSFCDSTTKQSASQQAPRYDSCLVDWDYGEWSAWSTTCGPAATRTRTATCVQNRPTSKEVVSSDLCNASTRQATLETAAQYSGCEAKWSYGDYGWDGVVGAKSSTCSSAPQQTRTESCEKIGLDGVLTTVDVSQCDPTKRQSTTTTLSADYSGCSYDWNRGDWSNWDSYCSFNAKRSRIVQCQRSDGTVASSESLCTSTKPTTSETAVITTGCANLVQDGGFESTTSIPQGTTFSGQWAKQTSAGTIALSSNAYTGSKSVLISGGGILYQSPVSISVTGTYTITFACRSNTGSNVPITVRAATLTGGNWQNTAWSCGASWSVVTIPFSWTATGNSNILIYTSSSTNSIYVDEVVFTKN